MKVAEIGAEMGKRVGRSVGESVSSRSTPGNHRLGSPRAPIYRRRGLQRQIISAELSRPSPPPTQIASIPVWTNPSVQKTKGGDGGSGGGGAAIFTLPLWLFAAGSAWWRSGSLTSQSLRGWRALWGWTVTEKGNLSRKFWFRTIWTWGFSYSWWLSVLYLCRKGEDVKIQVILKWKLRQNAT